MASPFRLETPIASGKAPTINGLEGCSKVKSGPAMTSESKPVDEKKQGKKPAEDSKDGKLSGAELKKKAKEEKAARRMKEKQGKQTPGQDTVSAGTPSVEQPVSNAGPSLQKPTTPGPKQHKRTGSANTNAPKQLPNRPAAPQAAAPPQTSKETTKRLALFSHLYGGPRRTTIAGAGKDVHPAVLSLGIQISNYTVCGSNTRCIAMLLAFRSVCVVINHFDAR